MPPDNAPESKSADIRFRVALVGARGYVGQELLDLIALHPHFELVIASSRALAGKHVRDIAPAYKGPLMFAELTPQQIPWPDIDVVILALPNGHSDAYMAEIEKCAPSLLVIDLSADHRFDNDWDYGLPERNRSQLGGSKRIANPGCYATGIQLGLQPLLGMLRMPPSVFGVSGYSGAGTTPSSKNDPEKLRDNLIPYGFAGHVHEKEVGHQLAQPIHFMPHVAPWFRGIHLTIDCHLDGTKVPQEWRDSGTDAAIDVNAYFGRFYDDEVLIETSADVPALQRIQGQHHVEIGGFSFSRQNQRLSLCVTLDNLRKGAATQALQNLNLALGLAEYTGLRVRTPHGPARG